MFVLSNFVKFMYKFVYKYVIIRWFDEEKKKEWSPGGLDTWIGGWRGMVLFSYNCETDDDVLWVSLGHTAYTQLTTVVSFLLVSSSLFNDFHWWCCFVGIYTTHGLHSVNHCSKISVGEFVHLLLSYLLTFMKNNCHLIAYCGTCNVP